MIRKSSWNALLAVVALCTGIGAMYTKEYSSLGIPCVTCIALIVIRRMFPATNGKSTTEMSMRGGAIVYRNAVE